MAGKAVYNSRVDYEIPNLDLLTLLFSKLNDLHH